MCLVSSSGHLPCRGDVLYISHETWMLCTSSVKHDILHELQKICPSHVIMDVLSIFCVEIMFAGIYQKYRDGYGNAGKLPKLVLT